jgi:hypothetical protein
MPTTMYVVSVVQEEGDTFVKVQLSSGYVDIGMTFAEQETGEKWRVYGLAKIPAATHAMGLRGLTLEPVGHSGTLSKGDCLILEK